MNPIMNNNDVINFIDEVNKQKRLNDELVSVQNSPEIKQRRLDNTKQCGVNTCITSILSKICQESLPEVNGRTPEPKDLDKVVSDYISRRTGGKDATFYVKEAIRRNPNNTALQSMLNSVERLISETYEDKSIHPENITEEDLTFKMTPEIDDRLSQIIRDNNLDNLSEVIKDNVREVAVNEVELAKKEKEERQKLEDELMNDESITTEAALEEELRRRMVNETSFYEPSLFSGVMIHAFNNTPNTLGEFAESVNMEPYMEGVFSKLKASFDEKKAANAKEAVAFGAPAYSASVEQVYKQVYGAYQTEVNTIDTQKFESNFKKAINNTPSAKTVKLPDCTAYTDAIKKYKDEVKASITLGKPSGEKPPKIKYTNYDLSDTLAQFKRSINVLDKEFSNPDMKAFVEKYSKAASSCVNKAETAKVVNQTYKALTNIALAHGSELLCHVEFIAGLSKYAKSLIDHASATPVKEAAFDNAITEFTMLNISKALRLESFRLADIKEMANEYAKN